jgi:hypothetical protein
MAVPPIVAGKPLTGRLTPAANPDAMDFLSSKPVIEPIANPNATKEVTSPRHVVDAIDESNRTPSPNGHSPSASANSRTGNRKPPRNDRFDRNDKDVKDKLCNKHIIEGRCNDSKCRYSHPRDVSDTVRDAQIRRILANPAAVCKYNFSEKGCVRDNCRKVHIDGSSLSTDQLSQFSNAVPDGDRLSAKDKYGIVVLKDRHPLYAVILGAKVSGPADRPNYYYNVIACGFKHIPQKAVDHLVEIDLTREEAVTAYIHNVKWVFKRTYMGQCANYPSDGARHIKLNWSGHGRLEEPDFSMKGSEIL